MDNFDENAILIADYLEDRLSPEEEELFVRRLGKDAGLRQQFEDELLARALLDGSVAEDSEDRGRIGEMAPIRQMPPIGEMAPLGEMAPIGEQAVGKPVGPGDSPVPRMRPLPRRRMQPMYYAAAAAVVLAATWMTVRLVSGTGDKLPTPVVAAHTDTLRDSLVPPPVTEIRPQTETGVSQPAVLLLLTSNRSADSAFRANYTPYIDDPSIADSERRALRPFYAAYQRGDFDTVLKATDADLGGSGAGAYSRPAQYLHFYKGLCYLASGTNVAVMQKALAEFESVPDQAPDHALFFDAQWYALLTALRIGDLAKARTLIDHLTVSSSSYQTRAASLRNLTR